MTAPEDSHPEVVRHYRLLRELGRGGMGLVFEGVDRRDESRVAVKLLHAHLAFADETFRERFQREAHVAALLRSPFTVHLLDYGVDQGTYFIVEEFVDGRSLADLIKQGPLEPVRALRVAGEVAQALEEAGARGVVHRDIKPENILIDEEGTVKVTDFGIARRASGPGLTLGGGFVGTAAYAAPEQVLGEADQRTDIYQLGATLYCMLSGRPPFVGPTVADVLRQHRTASVPMAPIGHLPDAVVNIVRRCLEKDPLDRYQTATELVGAIERARQALGRSATANSWSGAPPHTTTGGTPLWPARGGDTEPLSTLDREHPVYAPVPEDALEAAEMEATASPAGPQAPRPTLDPTLIATGAAPAHGGPPAPSAETGKAEPQSEPEEAPPHEEQSNDDGDDFVFDTVAAPAPTTQGETVAAPASPTVIAPVREPTAQTVVGPAPSAAQPQVADPERPAAPTVIAAPAPAAATVIAAVSRSDDPPGAPTPAAAEQAAARRAGGPSRKNLVAAIATIVVMIAVAIIAALLLGVGEDDDRRPPGTDEGGGAGLTTPAGSAAPSATGTAGTPSATAAPSETVTFGPAGFGKVSIAAGAPIRVGFSGPLEGDSSALGLKMEAAAKLAVDGKSVQGHAIEWVPVNDDCSAEGAAKAAGQLVQLGVHVVIGPVCTAGIAASQPVFERAGITQIAPSTQAIAATAPARGQAFKTFLRVSPNGAAQGTAAAQFAIGRGAETAAVVFDAQSPGALLKDRFVRQFEAGGGKLAMDPEGFTSGSAPFAGLASRVNASKPDVVYFAGGGQDAAAFLVELRKLSPTVVFIGSDELRASAAFLGTAKGAAEGAFSSEEFVVPAGKGFSDFASRYAAATGEDVSKAPSYVSQSFDAAQVAVAALAAAAEAGNAGAVSLDMARVNELARTSTLDGASGAVRFNERGDNVGTEPAFVFYVVKDGKFVQAD